MPSRRILSRSILMLLHVVIGGLSHHVGAQTPVTQAATPAGTASLSGRVVVDGKPAPGVHLALQKIQVSGSTGQDALKTRSDSEGRFIFSGLAAGSFEITPLNSAFVWGVSGFREAAASISLADNEQLTNVDVALKRGAVITGKVTDSEGNPVIARLVQLEKADGRPGAPPVQIDMQFRTDDRGIYRYYGVAAGRYRVSCGAGEGSFDQGSSYSLPRTFHPNVTDQAAAKIIEVREGSEASSVDIRMSPPIKVLSIAGRVIDDSGQGVKRALIMGERLSVNRSMGQRLTVVSQDDGGFELTGLSPGSWRFTTQPSPSPGATGGGGYSEPLTLDVQDDLADVEIRMKRGGTISGTVAIEGGNNSPTTPRLAGSTIGVSVTAKEPGSSAGYRSSRISADDSFLVEGLSPGTVYFNLPRNFDSPALALARIERDGAPVRQGFEIEAGENVTGIRLVYTIANSVISGQVTVSGGQLPAGVRMIVLARQSAGGRGAGNAFTDSRGNFLIENIPAGEYDLTVSARLIADPAASVPGSAAKQTVTVQSGQKVNVNLEYRLAPQ